MPYTIRFRLERLDGSDPSDLLDDVHEYFVQLGYDVDVIRGEFGPNWFALVLELPPGLDAEEFASELARNFASGFPHQTLVGEVADDAGRRLYPALAFDA